MKRRTTALLSGAMFLGSYGISSVQGVIYDLTTYPYGTLDQNAAGVNAGSQACAPTSTANSFAMLQAKYNIPGLVQPAGGGNSSAVNTANALVTAMQTDPQSGTKDANMISGKINYINNQGLSNAITVEYQAGSTTVANRNSSSASGTNTVPTLTFLGQQLAKGQDVEMGFNWITSTGAIDGGHWVTVDYYNTDTNTIGFLDPWNNTAGGGAVQCYTNNVTTYNLNTAYNNDIQSPNYIDFTYYGGAAQSSSDPDNPDRAGEGFVDVIVAESPVPEPALIPLAAVGATGLFVRRRRLAV